MYLEHDEVVVVPPKYRLFDCMRIRVSLIPENEAKALDVDSLWRVKVSVGMIQQDNHVEVVTENFRLGDVPRREEAIRYWSRAHTRAPAVKLGRSILLYFKYLSGVRAEFPVVDGEMKRFTIHLDTFQIGGDLPPNFSIETYFGETSKLED